MIRKIIHIDEERCNSCGLCASTCPEVFSIGDSGMAEAIDVDVPEEVVDAAAEAKDGCPVAAIELE